MSISPFTAFNAAVAQDPRNRGGRRVPKHPSDPPGTGAFARLITQAIYAIDLFIDQCNVDPFVFVEASTVAAWDAFVSIIEPDIKEAYHQLVGSSLVCSLKEEIGGKHHLDTKFYDGLRQTLFKTAEVADLAVWRLFLAAILAEGLIEAQTIAQEIEGCFDGKNPLSSSTGFGAMGDVDHAENANGLEWITSDPVYPAFTPNVQLRPGQTGAITWACEIQTGDHHDVPCVHWLDIPELGYQSARVTTPQRAGKGYHTAIRHWRGTNSSGGIITVRVLALCAVPVVNHEAFFKTGFCSVIQPGIS